MTQKPFYNSDERFFRQGGNIDLASSPACLEVLVWVMKLTREVRPASGLDGTKRHFEVCLSSQQSEPCPAVNLHEQKTPSSHLFNMPPNKLPDRQRRRGHTKDL